ncbi:hypothetical protein LB515_10120 [Mesorhizobium sp. CA15]|uniref:hypothetical protein n=1 Tax=Mesorhizobium sp. CA15 TaxID=2876641 RepID=UPI001CD1936F|nr:hypothetical protein [Mesorhizobium sp. CA15]MBZ9865731.1 hypothetical protein [Mesorhizobium sp. CA15]
MSDLPEDIPESSFWMTFDFDKLRWPAREPGIFHNFLPLVGFIAVSWSDFEQLFDEFLATMIAVNGSSHPRWERLNFRKRRNLFRNEMVTALVAMPEVSKFLSDLTHDAAKFHWKRNLLLHGKLATSWKNKIWMLHASGRHNGRIMEIQLSLSDLDDLRHEVAQIAGRMDLILKSHHPLREPFASHERSLLRALILKGRQIRSILPPP